MGNGSSFEQVKTIYLDINGKEEKIIFSRHSSPLELQELIAQAAGVTKHSVISLRDKNGAHVAVSPTMPANSAPNPYKVMTREPPPPPADNDAFQAVLTHVAEQLNRLVKLDEMKQNFNARITLLEKKVELFRMEETRSHLNHRINMLEKRIEMEGLKAVEIEKCKSEISYIRDQLWNAQKKYVDFNRLRPILTSGSCDHFFSSLSDERKISLKRDIPTYPKVLTGQRLRSIHHLGRMTNAGQLNTAISDETKINLKRDIPNYPKYTLSQETVDYLKQPTFDIWHWEPNEMLSLLEHMYHELGLVEEFNINPIVLKRWLLCVQENYRNNPFHNFRHCFCVSQMMYGMIHLCKLWERMTTEDLGILLTAAVCHDLDHPGYNNTYQINARTELAIRYNDISPLENHHCAVAFQILSNPDTNIFAYVDKDTFKRIRAGITMLILATDMARHAEIMESFKEKLAAGFDDKNKDHLDTLKMVLIKCCDISNEVRPMEVSEPWVDCLLEEYFNQSDREKIEGLPVAPFMDRDKVTKPTAQIGFIKFVLIPMFETVAKVFTQIDEVMVQPLKNAKDRYEEMKSIEEAQKEAKKALTQSH